MPDMGPPPPLSSARPQPVGRRLALLLAAGWLLVPAPGRAGETRPAGLKADRVVVHKGLRLMHLIRGEETLRSFRVALGRRPVGHKQEQGDGRTPEGSYRLDGRRERGESAFYRAIRISYPSPDDLASARARGVPPGGNIVIHGLPNGIRAETIDHPDYDWTNGCIAVTNAEMDEIWELIADGTPIDIHP